MQPSVIVLAGPNGAGKTTASREAQSPTVLWLTELAEARMSFAFETTLASRSFAPRIRGLRENGYSFHLFYFWLPSAEMAIARVVQRVRLGGHYVDDETVRRRYERGIQNFFRLYRPITTSWRFFDNSQSTTRSLVARGGGKMDWVMERPSLWQRLRNQYDSPPPSAS